MNNKDSQDRKNEMVVTLDGTYNMAYSENYDQMSGKGWYFERYTDRAELSGEVSQLFATYSEAIDALAEKELIFD